MFGRFIFLALFALAALLTPGQGRAQCLDVTTPMVSVYQPYDYTLTVDFTNVADDEYNTYLISAQAVNRTGIPPVEVNVSGLGAPEVNLGNLALGVVYFIRVYGAPYGATQYDYIGHQFKEITNLDGNCPPCICGDCICPEEPRARNTTHAATDENFVTGVVVWWDDPQGTGDSLKAVITARQQGVTFPKTYTTSVTLKPFQEVAFNLLELTENTPGAFLVSVDNGAQVQVVGNAVDSQGNIVSSFGLNGQ